MALELHIPIKHLAWFRQKLAEEVSCDIEDSAPSWESLGKADLEETEHLAVRARRLFDELGYPGDEEQEVTLALEARYAAYLVEQGVSSLGEEMLVASGNYKGHPHDPDKVREVSKRGIWLSALRDQIGDVEPSREIEGSEC
jgi:hypothetical protein